MPVRQNLQETKDAPSERGKPLPLAGGESLVEQAEDGSGQQNDERPNHAPDHPLKNINPGSLGVNPGTLGVDSRGLGVDSRVDFGEPRLHLGPQFSDLGSDGGNDVLPTQIPDFLNGGMNQIGVVTILSGDHNS